MKATFFRIPSKVNTAVSRRPSSFYPFSNLTFFPLASHHFSSHSPFPILQPSKTTMISQFFHLPKLNKQIISFSSPWTHSPPPRPRHLQNPHHCPPHHRPHRLLRTIPPPPFPNDPVHQSPSRRRSLIIKWVLFEEGLAISRHFRDWVLRKIDFLEILQGIERSQRLHFFDVVGSEDQLGQFRKLGDPGDGGIVQPSQQKSVLVGTGVKRAQFPVRQPVERGELIFANDQHLNALGLFQHLLNIFSNGGQFEVAEVKFDGLLVTALLLEAIVDGFDQLVAHYLNIGVKYLNQFEGRLQHISMALISIRD